MQNDSVPVALGMVVSVDFDALPFDKARGYKSTEGETVTYRPNGAQKPTTRRGRHGSPVVEVLGRI